MPAVSNCVCKWKHPSCCLTKKLKTFVCPGRSLGNATRSAFLSVGTSGVCVSGVRRAGLKKNLQNSRKTGLSQLHISWCRCLWQARCIGLLLGDVSLSRVSAVANKTIMIILIPDCFGKVVVCNFSFPCTFPKCMSPRLLCFLNLLV